MSSSGTLLNNVWNSAFLLALAISSPQIVATLPPAAENPPSDDVVVSRDVLRDFAFLRVAILPWLGKLIDLFKSVPDDPREVVELMVDILMPRGRGESIGSSPEGVGVEEVVGSSGCSGDAIGVGALLFPKSSPKSVFEGVPWLWRSSNVRPVADVEKTSSENVAVVGVGAEILMVVG